MAFRVATTGVPGPVFLEMPLDILMNFAKDSDLVRPTKYRSEYTPAPAKDAAEDAVRLLDAAERPMLICGSQIRWSRDKDALTRFLAKRPMPTFLNGMARGALPPAHECFMSRSRRNALSEADVVVVLSPGTTLIETPPNPSPMS